MADAGTNWLMWEEPPPRARRSEWTPILVALKARPGYWARLATCANVDEAHRVASSLRNLAAKMSGTWEIVGRYIPDKDGGGVWGRFIPAAEVLADDATLLYIDEAAHVSDAVWAELAAGTDRPDDDPLDAMGERPPVEPRPPSPLSSHARP